MVASLRHPNSIRVQQPSAALVSLKIDVEATTPLFENLDHSSQQDQSLNISKKHRQVEVPQPEMHHLIKKPEVKRHRTNRLIDSCDKDVMALNKIHP